MRTVGIVCFFWVVLLFCEFLIVDGRNTAVARMEKEAVKYTGRFTVEKSGVSPYIRVITDSKTGCEFVVTSDGIAPIAGTCKREVE